MEVAEDHLGGDIALLAPELQMTYSVLDSLLSSSYTPFM
jgi:hypothetical protein